MNRKMILCFTLAVISLFSMVSCTIRLTNVWKNEDFRGDTPFKKIFVLVALQDPVIKGLFEEEFVSQFIAYGTASAPSFEFFSHYLVTKEKITSIIKALDADTLLIVRLTKSEKDQTYFSGGEYVMPTWYHDWYLYYTRSFSDIDTPLYKDEGYLAIAETNIYDTKTEKLIWFARSQVTFIACSCQEIIPFVKAIIDRLSSDHLLIVRH